MVSDSAMTIRNRLRHALVDRTATRAERRACFFTTLYETEFDDDPRPLAAWSPSAWRASAVPDHFHHGPAGRWTDGPQDG